MLQKVLFFNMVQAIDLIFCKVIEMIEQSIFKRADFSFRSQFSFSGQINGLFHFLSVQGDGRKKFKSIFALDFFDMNILSPGKQLGKFSVSLEFHSELPSIFASFVLSKCQWM